MRKIFVPVIFLAFSLCLTACVGAPSKQAMVEVVKESLTRTPSPISADVLSGQVKNTGTVPVYSVHVEATFYLKNRIFMEKTYDLGLESKTAADALNPGDTANFEIAPFGSMNYETYELKVTWSENKDQ
jgi:hypothetical protein